MGLHAWHQVISNNEWHLQCAITCSLNDTLLQSTHPSDSLWQSSIPYQALSLQEQGPVSCAVLSTSLVIGVLVARNRNIDWWRGMSCIHHLGVSCLPLLTGGSWTVFCPFENEAAVTGCSGVVRWCFTFAVILRCQHCPSASYWYLPLRA